MTNKIFLTGVGESAKSVSLLNSDDPTIWNFYSNLPKRDQDVYYSRVSAAYRAFNLTADVVGNMPFIVYTKNGEEYDSSKQWENKVGFLPNPSEILRLATLSLMSTNTAYDLITTDALGYKSRGMYHLVPYSMNPVTDPVTGELLDIERTLNAGQKEHYAPDDKRLIRIWKLDHTTEVLPSQNTDAMAILNAAGEIYFADLWIRYFFQRGGIKPTLIAMKGLVPDKEEREKNWSDFLRGLGKFTHRIARIFNAETMTIQPFGSGVDDLKDNKIYEGAIANIAMATGMPLSLLLANSANFATAQTEMKSWLDNKIIPFCNFLAYEYNRQCFVPRGYYLEFKPESLDPEQEDETERASAISAFIDFLNKCPSADIALETATTFGYELTDNLIKAIKKHFEEKKKEALAVQDQMNKPAPAPSGATQPAQEQGTDYTGRTPREPYIAPDQKPAKWAPSIDELKELGVWRDVALRRFKKGESLDFEYQPHYGGLPGDLTAHIAVKLKEAIDAEAIKSVFEYRSDANDETLVLAASMNKLADALFAQKA